MPPPRCRCGSATPPEREIDAVGAHQVFGARVELDRVLEQHVRLAARDRFEGRGAAPQLVAQHAAARLTRNDLAGVRAVPRLTLGQARLARRARDRHAPTPDEEDAVQRAERAATGSRQRVFAQTQREITISGRHGRHCTLRGLRDTLRGHESLDARAPPRGRLARCSQPPRGVLGPGSHPARQAGRRPHHDRSARRRHPELRARPHHGQPGAVHRDRHRLVRRRPRLRRHQRPRRRPRPSPAAVGDARAQEEGDRAGVRRAAAQGRAASCTGSGRTSRRASARRPRASRSPAPTSRPSPRSP